MKDQAVDAGGIALSRQRFYTGNQSCFGLRLILQCGPLLVEPLAQILSLSHCVRLLNQTQWIAGCKPHTFCVESKCTQNSLLCNALLVTQNECALGNTALSLTHLRFSGQPIGKLPR
jgi:hypothetical protein